MHEPGESSTTTLALVSTFVYSFTMLIDSPGRGWQSYTKVRDGGEDRSKVAGGRQRAHGAPEVGIHVLGFGVPRCQAQRFGIEVTKAAARASSVYSDYFGLVLSSTRYSP